MIKHKKTSSQREIGRSVPKIDFDSLEKTFLVPQDILDSVLTTDRLQTVRGISLMMAAKTITTRSTDTNTQEFNLLYANVPDPSSVASIQTETVKYRSIPRNTTHISIAITSLVKHRGADSSKATHILAAMVGYFHAQNIQNIAKSLDLDQKLEVRLLLDTEKDDRSITSFWEFESSLERVLWPYSKSTNAPVKILLSSTI
jgi:hypothetical protein